MRRDRIARCLLLVLLLLAAGCFPRWPQTVTVLHSDTGRPIHGVQVSPYYEGVLGGPKFDTAVTGADGTARLNLGWGLNYSLTFILPNGIIRRAWLGTHSGWTFRLWPEPYRELTVVVPAAFRGVLYVALQEDSPDDVADWLPELRLPRYTGGPESMAKREVAGITVFDEGGRLHAGWLAAVRFDDGTTVPVEKQFGPRRPGVAARPIGYWNAGPYGGSRVYAIGTIAEAERMLAKLIEVAPRRSIFSRTSSLTPNHGYQPDYDGR